MFVFGLGNAMTYPNLLRQEPAAKGPVIRILEKYRNDRGIYAHEHFHVKQWWGCFSVFAVFAFWLPIYHNPYWYYLLILGAGAHAALYLIFDEYRLWSEVQAYKKQAQYYADDRRLLFAHYIHTSYNLGDKVTERQIYERLKA